MASCNIMANMVIMARSHFCKELDNGHEDAASTGCAGRHGGGHEHLQGATTADHSHAAVSDLTAINQNSWLASGLAQKRATQRRVCVVAYTCQCV